MVLARTFLAEVGLKAGLLVDIDLLVGTGIVTNRTLSTPKHRVQRVLRNGTVNPFLGVEIRLPEGLDIFLREGVIGGLPTLEFVHENVAEHGGKGLRNFAR
jgi:hypothetical protein